MHIKAVQAPLKRHMHLQVGQAHQSGTGTFKEERHFQGLQAPSSGTGSCKKAEGGEGHLQAVVSVLALKEVLFGCKLVRLVQLQGFERLASQDLDTVAQDALARRPGRVECKFHTRYLTPHQMG